MSNQAPMLRKKEKEKEKENIQLEFVNREEIAEEMDSLLKHYKTDLSKADLEETRKIFHKISSLSDELAEMRDENI
jgi:hypothetical protein